MTLAGNTIRVRLTMLVILATGLEALAVSYTMRVEPIRASGIFRPGEEVAFRIAALKNGVPIAGQSLAYEIKTSAGEQLASGTVTLSRGPAVVKAKAQGPAIVVCKASYSTGNVTDSSSEAVVVGPELFKPAFPPPDDFDAFWQAQRQLLKSQRPKADLQPLVLPEDLVPPHRPQFNGLVVHEVQIQVMEGVASLRGHLARPKAAKPKSLPAIVYPQERGLRFFGGSAHRSRRGQPPPPRVSTAIVGRMIPAARLGMLALSYYFEDLPGALPKPPEATASPDAAASGTGDRETHFLRGAILRQMAAVDFLTQQPEWNGQILIVQAEGVGGGLALAAAGLDERVTLCIAARPAMCDLGAEGASRAGWPYAPFLGRAPLPPPDEKSRNAGRYFDATSFATRIRCETVVTVDYDDLTAPATGVYAAFNSIPAKVNKRIVRVGASGRRTKDEAQLDGIVRKHAQAAGAVAAPPGSAATDPARP